MTTNSDGVKINKRTDSNSSYETIQLISGKNKCIEYNFGFYFNTSGDKVISFDLNNYNTSEIVNMNNMFSGCNTLTDLDLSHFNTSNVTNMSYMFYVCNKLKSLNLKTFNTSKVTDMNNMFRGCNVLTDLDLSNFNTSNVTDMSSMFSYCNELKSLDLSSFNTSNVKKTMNMFQKCENLAILNVSNFDMKNVDTMWITGMFDYCSKLSKVICKQAFKDWCIEHEFDIVLPETMVNGTVGAVGSGSNWEIIDYQS